MKKRVGVLMGGQSHEKEVSLKTGKQISKALKQKGYDVVDIIINGDNLSKIIDAKIDVAFLALHGKIGEDGTIQGFLDFLNIPYTGTKVLGSSISMNKQITKDICYANNILFPKGVKINSKTYCKESLKNRIRDEKIDFPVVLKPNDEGSAVGLHFVDNFEELFNKIDNDFQLSSELLIEEMISGTEITVGLLDGKALDIIHLTPKSGINDFEAKYKEGMSDFVIPAKLSSEVYKEAQRISEILFDKLYCHYYCRLDLIVKNDKCYVLEMNTLPGMTETSLLPMAAKYNGISFEDLVEKILLNT